MDASRVVWAAVLAAIPLCGLFAGFVLVYGAWGPVWASGQARRIGELRADEAERLAEAGFTEEAIASYRGAFEARFDDPNQRVWRMQEYAELLLEEGHAEQAAEVARQALAEGRYAGKSHSLRNAALRRAGAFEAAAQAARAWAEWAAAKGHAEALAWALYYRGWALERMEEDAEALAAYEQSFEVHPMTETALAAGKLLAQEGAADQARAFFEYVVRNDAGAKAGKAQELLADMGS